MPINGRVLFYGDSLMVECFQRVLDNLDPIAEKIIIRRTSGNAPCDFFRNADGYEFDRYAVKLFVIETAADSQTACMGSPEGNRKVFLPYGSQAWMDKLRADMNLMLSLPPAHIPILVINPPPFSDAQREKYYTTVLPLLEEDAAMYANRITFTDVPRLAVSDNGAFTATLPRDSGDPYGVGPIAVRAPDGVHFCPFGMDPKNKATGCSGYSSGARRFADAISSEIIAALA